MTQSKEEIDHELDLLAEELVKLKEEYLVLVRKPEEGQTRIPQIRENMEQQIDTCGWLGYYHQLDDLYRRLGDWCTKQGDNEAARKYNGTDIQFEIENTNIVVVFVVLKNGNHFDFEEQFVPVRQILVLDLSLQLFFKLPYRILPILYSRARKENYMDVNPVAMNFIQFINLSLYDVGIKWQHP